MRIPRRLHLPFGYVITIKQVSAKDDALLDQDTGLYLDGSWSPETRTITINKALPVKRRKYLALHELAHSINDMMHELLDKGVIQP